MPKVFNTLLREAGLELKHVRLVRHKDKRAAKGHTPFDLWHDDREQFESYQSTQGFHKRKTLNAKYWAVFLGTPDGETLFIGLYEVEYLGRLKENRPNPSQPGVIERKGKVDEYRLKRLSELKEFIGKLVIDWGPGKRAWAQYAHNREKRIIGSSKKSRSATKKAPRGQTPRGVR